MSLIRKLLTILAFTAVAVLALPTMPSNAVDKTQQVLQAKAKNSKQAKKSKNKGKKKKSAELQALEARQAQAAEPEQYAEQEPAEEQVADQVAEQDLSEAVQEQPQANENDLESAFAEVQQEAKQDAQQDDQQAQPAPQPPAESALQPVEQQKQAAAPATSKPAPVNPAVLNTKPGQQSFILKNKTAAAPVAAASVNSAEDTQLAPAADEKTYVNRFKKQRQKKSVAEYDSVQNAKRDSILAITYHFGLSFIGGRTHDKRLGHLDLDSDWGGNFGIYLFYRHYFNNYLAMQGRLGAMYRYARFSQEKDFEDRLSFGGKKYDLNDKMNVSYSNIAVDAPITFKAGAHVTPTSFLFVSLAGGVTKSMYDHIETDNTLTVKNPSKELAETLKALEKENRYPLEDIHTTAGAFYVDDWELNSWVGAGIDGKYVSLEYQVLIAASSTKDNHRFQPIYSGNYPTWRIMVDFSLK